MTEPSSSPPIFSRFQELPLEIRLKIWADACHQPRFIGLWCKRYTDNTRYSVRFTISSPHILRVSSEARAEASKHYILRPYLYGGDWTEPFLTRFSTRINFEYETFCPMGHWDHLATNNFISQEGQECLHSLALDISTTFYEHLYDQYLSNKIWPFRVLEKLILYDAEDIPAHDWDTIYGIGAITLDFAEIKTPSPALRRAEEVVRSVVEREMALSRTKPRISMKMLVIAVQR